MRKIFVSLIIFHAAFVSAQKFEGLAKTPPMGWNTWNKFGCEVDEELIRQTVDAMVESGMKEAGYTYIVIDDCWHGERDSLGFIQAHPERFPSGIKALTDYVHSKGLKFGIYSCAGYQTCAGRPGSRGHEYQDAIKYAEWGVDYLKYDWCYTEGLKAEGAYMTMRDALFEAGRPMVFSLCEWGNDNPWEWGREIGHLWRISGDIYNCFDCKQDHGTWFSWGVLQILDMRTGIRQYHGPDHWNDPDMMEVGNGMSVNEDRAHFSLWAMLAAPLFAGNDLLNMTDETRKILTNKEVIAIDQDSLGIQGFKHIDEEDYEVWVKPLSGGNLAVCFLNRSTEPMEVAFDWTQNRIKDPVYNLTYEFTQNAYTIFDLWSGKNTGTTQKEFTAKIPGHDVIMLKLTRK